MSRITLPRSARRLATAAATVTAAVVLTATPAAAHVEVESDNAQALAENAEISFLAQSESASAGITELRVVLPEGIAPADVTYEEGPKGWTFTTTDDGYTVKGPAVKIGEDAEYSITVRQLPDAEELVFKTLQTYSDGRVDRWIELGESDGHEHGHDHGNSAPVLKLQPAAPGATPLSPSPGQTATEPASPAPTTENAEPSASPASEEKRADDGGLSTGAWIGIAAAVLVVAGAGVHLLRRRADARQ